MAGTDDIGLVGRLPGMAERAGVVGAVASVSFDGQRTDAATGRLDARSDARATTSSPFRLGSITKALTATVLRSLLAEHGRSLDEPVAELLPDTVPVGRGEPPITWRHVLLHRSGIDGTFWEGRGDGPDAIATYARDVASLTTVFPAGASWGYSNSAYVLAGRAVEVLTDSPYDIALRELLLEPGGLSSTTLWSDPPPEGAANGHHGIGPDARPADVPTGLRALAPAGATAFSTAVDALAFADHALRDDWHALAAEATPLPPAGGSSATHQALGWKVWRWGDDVMFGHDGGSTGQGSFLRWIPATNTGVALLANTAPAAMLLWADLSEWFFEQAGLRVPGWITAEDGVVAEPEWRGEYRCRDATFTVSDTGDGLELHAEGLGGSLSTTATLKPLRPGVYRASAMITDPTRIVSFERPVGAARLIHCGPFTARADGAEPAT